VLVDRLEAGLSNENDIAQLFASSYKDLYTSVPYNEHDIMNRS